MRFSFRFALGCKSSTVWRYGCERWHKPEIGARIDPIAGTADGVSHGVGSPNEKVVILHGVGAGIVDWNMSPEPMVPVKEIPTPAVAPVLFTRPLNEGFVVRVSSGATDRIFQTLLTTNTESAAAAWRGAAPTPSRARRCPQTRAIARLAPKCLQAILSGSRCRCPLRRYKSH